MAGQTIILAGPRQRRLAQDIIAEAPDRAIVNVRPSTRSSEQNAQMWAIMSDISRAKPDGRTHTPEIWKCLFMHACGHEVQFVNGLDGRPFPQGFRSSRMTVGEMCDLITFAIKYADEKGILLTDRRYS